jgi:magnesium transporter
MRDTALARSDTVTMQIDCAAYVDGERRPFDPDVDTIDDLPTGFVWLGLRIPDVGELDRSCAALALVGVESGQILTPHTRPVLTIEHGTIVLVIRTASYQDPVESIELGEMTLLVGERAIVTIRHGPASPLATVRASLEADPARLRLGPSAVLAAAVNQVIDDYGPALDGFENDVVEVEGDVFSDTRRQPVQRLYQLKREIRRMYVAIDALQDPLARLIRLYGASVAPEIRDDLVEAADQLDRAVTRAMSLSELVDAALTASLTQISVQQNDDMRKISAWVAMAAVPTLIAGIYGMNFEHMPELENRFGYPAVVGGIAVIVGLLYRQFKKSGWL